MGVSTAVWTSQYVCPVLTRLRHTGMSEAVGGARPAHTGVDVTRVAPNVAEYWIEATERIMDDLDFTAEQKLKRAGIQPNRLTWDYFKTAFQSKYVAANYIDVTRRKFLNLTQGDCSGAEYEAEFLSLSRCARGMVATEYERCFCFEDGLRDSLRREPEFATLVDKAKITEEVKCAECQNRKKEKNKRESEPSNSVMRPKKKAKSIGPVRVGPPVTPTGVALCGHCGRRRLLELV
ncbi:1-phosphatidylinositol-4,5-bisphosphate phosphodiesterase beta-2 [Gossypium australe]|uniref:1-phosphatidylinositol-4,5-bisphosphate phosphodiesterase beta-2 n=1 Tax=Gossypium australe TaxID=47621 RepID=A0A5B6VCT6_9ROSI|nr:1-phosphatidylinositol-4,5-bisphosphate phosphodiesterase beta-2 [Gossypium australe]